MKFAAIEDARLFLEQNPDIDMIELFILDANGVPRGKLLHREELLADVVAALPSALRAAGADARLLLPGLPAVMAALQSPQMLAELGPCFGVAGVRLWKGRLAVPELPVYVVDAPMLYRREGGPCRRLLCRNRPCRRRAACSSSRSRTSRCRLA